MDQLHRGVHLAAHVVGLPPGVNGALIVDGQGGVGFEIVVHGVRIAIAPGLVAKRPHDNGGIAVEFVPLVEAGNPVQIVAPPFGIVGEGVVGGGDLVGKGPVGLQIVLVHDIDAVLVRQFY